MSKTLKWIFIILGILAGLGLLATLGYAWYLASQGGYVFWKGPIGHGWSPRMGDWYPRPMMLPRAFLPFGGLFFFGNLLKWLFLVALLYGAYWLGKHSVASVNTSTPEPGAPSRSENPQPDH